jgi:hypothetical protein
MEPGQDRRRHERRLGERRRLRRAAGERRQGERRRLTAASAVAAALLAGEAQAQIYTRRNDKGVLEATNAPDASDYRLTYPGKGDLIHSRAWRLRPRYSGEFDHHITDAAARHGVNVDLVRAVIQVESSYDHLAVSTKGARGLMQLMPDTARRFGVGDSFDPRQNVYGGVRYLRFLLDLFSGNVTLAAAAYNAGENAVLRYGGIPPYRETQGYVEKVRALYGMMGNTVATGTQQAARFFTPQAGADAAAPPGASSTARAPRKAAARKPPSVFYRWKDESGVVHVAQNPPSPGLSYTVIRGQD